MGVLHRQASQVLHQILASDFHGFLNLESASHARERAGAGDGRAASVGDKADARDYVVIQPDINAYRVPTNAAHSIEAIGVFQRAKVSGFHEMVDDLFRIGFSCVCENQTFDVVKDFFFPVHKVNLEETC